MTWQPTGADKGRLRHKAEFLCRTATPNEEALDRCAIFGCGRLPQARAGRGASLTHCRYHVQYRNRHGSFWKGTYTAAELKPYRRAAESYLKAHMSDYWVAHALTTVQSLMNHAGPVERMVDVKRMRQPADKARAAFARMRRAEIPPLRLLVNHLAVTMAVREDPIRPGDEGDDYRITQCGKRALRVASGYHSKYGPGMQYDVYPRSSGRAIRHIGRMLEGACEHVIQEHLPALLALKVERFGRRCGQVRVGKPA